MRKSRILCWVCCLVVAVVLFVGENFFKGFMVEKAALYVCAPKEMKSAFERALKNARLNKSYEIVMTDDVSKANIVIDMGKEFDPEYIKIAYSPFVVVYSSEDKNIKSMIDRGLLQDALFNNYYQEINFNKVIEEVLKEGKWENLGVKDMGTIKVYYPKFGTKYYTDYYDFMLVTINGGVYPKNESQLKKAMEQIELFEKSDYTEAVKDFDEKINRAGGFMENTFYLIPEQEASMLAKSNVEYGRLFYPTTTVYANYYVKADELGYKLVDVFDMPNTNLGNFYNYIEWENYRSDWDDMLEEFSDKLYGERDVYNVLHLDKDRIRPESLDSKEENVSNTQ